MKFGIQAENPLEGFLIWLGDKKNKIPMPSIHGPVSEMNAKVVNTALKLGIFEAAREAPQTLEEIAEKTGLNADSLRSVMMLLVFLRYFKFRKGKFQLTPVAMKYCVKENAPEFYDNTMFSFIMADWLDQLEEYLRTGKGLDVHKTMKDEEWRLYQQSMETEAKAASKKAAEVTPLPPNPAAMLDIGGSHGLYSVELCKKYPTLKATILDLPQAVEKAQPILAKYNMGDKVCYLAGDACIDDLGENKYDLVLMSHLMHHLSHEQNTLVCGKAARALKPGGYFAVQEFIRPEFSDNLEKISNADALYSNIIFNISSESGTLNRDEIEEYQRNAGLTPCSVNKIRKASSFFQICARKM